ncbi:hypothetical protein EVAR_94087_1 [Eumeta japonica]|uniref:Uncharacterized protein n=1 Tax=Eumeta variegata TaxID=151549 RepID=A0A4C1V7T3_EUMVA|nr:hypothetical protein EVAR_94087_1 [Eumeta japonica]
MSQINDIFLRIYFYGVSCVFDTSSTSRNQRHVKSLRYFGGGGYDEAQQSAGQGAAAWHAMSAVSSHVHAPPLSAAEALSTLLWQPYECRSPPFVRARPDGAAAASARPAAPTASGLPLALASRSPQSPSGGRDARAYFYAFAIPSRPEMRLPVPAPATARECDSVSVRVPGAPDRANVSSVHIVPAADAAVNVSSAVQTDRERSVVSAHCQTEEPRRRRTRRARLSRCAPLSPPPPDLLEGNVPPPPYSTLPLHAAPPPHPPPPLLAAPPHPPPSLIPAPPPHHPLPPPPPQHRFPFQPVPLRRFKGGSSNLKWDIITSDETWIYCYDLKIKHQSTVWVYRDEPKPTIVALE